MSAAMLIDNHKPVILGLMQEGEALLQKAGDSERAQRIQTARLDAEKKREPTIMFYGLYNAGKSTLINALCKKEVAKTGDVPTTASIQAVPWEGYTLIDTPGINARSDHTEIAEKEIRQSDVILFVMDNADTFDNESVYQAIVDILKMGKPLAIVINQKNVDENEDPNVAVPNQASVQKIVGKVSANLETQGARNHMVIVGKEKNFLGIFPVNALTAAGAGGEELLYQVSGVLSLRNAINDSIRRSEQAYMLRTPLINLRDTLQEAVKAYQSAGIYGEKQQLAENREALIASRQRLRDRLLADGLRKIEAVMEQVKAAAANGQTTENVGQQLSRELNALLKEAAEQEQTILQSEIRLSAIPDYQAVSSTIAADTEDSSLEWGDLAGLAAVPLAVLLPEIVIPPIVIEKIIKFFFGLFSQEKRREQEAREAVQRSQAQLANYYKWLNELRDQEVQIKATFEKSVNDFLQQYYDPKLEQMNRALESVNSSCAEHTRNLRAMEQLLLRIGDEMAALAAA